MHLGRYLVIAIVTIGLAATSAQANGKNDKDDKKVTVLSNVQKVVAAVKELTNNKKPVKPKPPETPSCDGGYAPQFKLGGAVQNSKTFTYQDLQQYFPSRFTLSFVSGGTAGPPRTYIGVPLLDLLNEAVVVTNPNQRNDFLRKYIVATGTDCYEAIIAYADLLPNFGGQEVYIAFATGDGQPLGEGEGMARLFIVRDFQGGRHVSNVRAITIHSAP